MHLALPCLVAGMFLATAVPVRAQLLAPAPTRELEPRLEAFRRTLVDSGRPLTQVGDVLEILVRARISEAMSPNYYEVTGGLEYLDDGRVVGELDILVVEKPDGPGDEPPVIVVGEAKLWKNLPAGLEKARKQLKRFDDHLRGGKIDAFRYKPQPQRPWDDDQFGASLRYETWGCRGGQQIGFDQEIDLTPAEGATLFEMLKDRGLFRSRLFALLWPEADPRLAQ